MKIKNLLLVTIVLSSTALFGQTGQNGSIQVLGSPDNNLVMTLTNTIIPTNTPSSILQISEGPDNNLVITSVSSVSENKNPALKLDDDSLVAINPIGHIDSNGFLVPFSDEELAKFNYTYDYTYVDGHVVCTPR